MNKELERAKRARQVAIDTMAEKAQKIGYLNALSDVMSDIMQIVAEEGVLHEGVLMLPADSVSEMIMSKSNE